jgi:hypothetical protein
MQRTMLSGSAENVRQTVRGLIDAWSPGGGAIVTAAQTMLPDVPWENVLALVETVREYGSRKNVDNRSMGSVVWHIVNRLNNRFKSRASQSGPVP